jgi:hypothetical protein
MTQGLRSQMAARLSRSKATADLDSAGVKQPYEEYEASAREREWTLGMSQIGQSQLPHCYSTTNTF